MADPITTSVVQAQDGYVVKGGEPVSHTYHFVTSVFDSKNDLIARIYKPWQRCICLIDHNIYDLHEKGIQMYFATYGIRLSAHRVEVIEERKDFPKLLEICQIIADCSLLREEPILVIGGGLLTDVAG